MDKKCAGRILCQSDQYWDKLGHHTLHQVASYTTPLAIIYYAMTQHNLGVMTNHAIHVTICAGMNHGTPQIYNDNTMGAIARALKWLLFFIHKNCVTTY